MTIGVREDGDCAQILQFWITRFTVPQLLPETSPMVGHRTKQAAGNVLRMNITKT